MAVTDAFTGTGALDGNWTLLLSEITRVSGVAQGVSSGGNVARYTGVAFANNQYAQGVITDAVLAADGGFALMVRLDASGNGYLFIANTDGALLYKLTTLTTYALLQDLSSTFADGNSARIEVSGTTIRCYKNTGGGFVQIGTDQTDSSWSSGSAGLSSYTPNGTLDDFEAGDLAGSAMAGRLVNRGLVNGGLVGGRLIA